MCECEREKERQRGGGCTCDSMCRVLSSFKIYKHSKAVVRASDSQHACVRVYVRVVYACIHHLLAGDGSDITRVCAHTQLCNPSLCVYICDCIDVPARFLERLIVLNPQIYSGVIVSEILRFVSLIIFCTQVT